MTKTILENQRRLAAQQEAVFDTMLNKMRSIVSYNDSHKTAIMERGDALIAAIKEWQSDSCAMIDQSSNEVVNLINEIQGAPTRHMEHQAENVERLPRRAAE